MKKRLLSFLAITMIIATTIHAQIPTNGLVAYYPFSGNAIDSSGNGNNGTVNGATLTNDRFGKANSAYSFNGSSNFISLKSNYIQDFSSKFTISVWVNESYLNPNYNQTLVSSNAFRFQTGSGTKSLAVAAAWSPTGIPQPATSNIIQLNTWTNVILVKNDTTVNFYINGSKYDSSFSISSSLLVNNLRIGADGLTHIGLNDYFNGKLDDIAIYNRVLSNSEIQSLYHQEGFGIIKPIISSFNPKIASTGNTITIKGNAFTGVTSVVFGSDTASSFNVVNDSTITAIVGNGASGNIEVVTKYYSATLSGFIFKPINASIPTNGLVAWYPFSGNANDSSGNKYNGVVNGATLTTDRFGIPNSAYSFNGSSNFISLQSNYVQDFSSKFTISVWVNESYLNPNYNQTLVSSNAFRFQTGSGTKSLAVAAAWSPTGIPQPATSNIIQLNTWTNVTLVKNDTTVNFYINGSKFDSSFSILSSLLVNNLRIGADGLTHIGLNDYFNGKLDDIAIYNRVLNNSEIQSLYNQGGYALPTKLEDITAKVFDEKVILKWGTLTELNTTHFIIQQSIDGNLYTDIGTVKAIGSGANSYEFTNKKPANGINYYRFQSVDKDGSKSYSKVISVNFGVKQSFSIIPNPAKDFAIINFSKAVDKGTIAVYDITGKQVITQSLSGNTNTYKLNTQSLKSGLYVVKIITTAGNYNEKLLINK